MKNPPPKPSGLPSWVYAFFKFLYFLISYNRRVITPLAPHKRGFDCEPDFSFRYRLAFIGLAWLKSSFLLQIFITQNHLTFPFSTDLWQFTALFIVLHSLIFILDIKQRVEVMGQVGVCLLVGALLALPYILLSLFWNPPMVLNYAWAMLIGFFMAYQYIQRLKNIYLQYLKAGRSQ